MSSLETYLKRLSKGGNTIGSHHKHNSDMIMEQTWNNDIQAKKCYIQDYFHDDQKDVAQNISYSSSTTKTCIDAKFIITQYQTINKDAVEYHLQFKPSQNLYFKPSDDLFYYETDYHNRYGAEFPIGCYCDIPNENGIYEKWLICGAESQNQFPKYLILKCNYLFHWISENNGMRVKNKMWGVVKGQNSYNSGLWSSNISTDVENQGKAILPMNSITEYLYYTHPESKNNQRMIVSVLTARPNVWQISKVENHFPFGLQKITLYQSRFNDNTDYVDFSSKEMQADYFVVGSEPLTDPVIPSSDNTCTITASTNHIKAGGSYKVLAAKFYDKVGIDITENYLPTLTMQCWKFYIEDHDITDSDLVILLKQNEANKIKIRFKNDNNYFAKKMTVKCTVDDIVGEIILNIISL